jgi:pyruvate formate lyase activating enzyme
MMLHGLQKMTLLDFPGRVACTVFLGGCDFRCPFCHNYELVDGSAPALMEDGELFAFLEKRRGLLDGVAVTGGEPCLRPDLPELLSRIKVLGYDVKLDTNGAHPGLLKALIDQKLVDYVAMDIKNSPEKYARTVGLETLDLAPVRQSVELLLSDVVDYEFRPTVVDELHEEKDFEAIGAWLKGSKRLYLQQFTDSGDLVGCGCHAVEEAELRAFARLAEPYFGSVEIRGID